MARIRPDGALPAYLRIAETLTIEIGAGRLPAGAKLPPERQMAAAQGVTVTTLRKALAVLTGRGLLERRQGSGNYITGARGSLGTYAMFRLESHPDGGGLPTARLLDVTRQTKPVGFWAQDSSPYWAWRIRRQRSIGYVPVAVEEIWLDGAVSSALRPEALSESLYKTYAEQLSLHIDHVEDTVRLGPLPDWAPEALDLPSGHIMGLVERRAFDPYGASVEVSRTWFDTERARYHARVP